MGHSDDDQKHEGNAVVDPVEAALAVAVEAAAQALARGDAGALETLQALTGELKARREARANVVQLSARRRGSK